MNLILNEVGPNGISKLGSLVGNELSIGRNKSSNFPIDGQTVSWDHGLFVSVKSHWLYKDLASTNGSWLNGIRIAPEQWVVLRPGDNLQIADVLLNVASEGGDTSAFPNLGTRSLLVFSRGSFVEEFPVPEFGRALVVGGAKADLKLDVDIHELPSLVIERRGEKVCAFSVAKEVTIQRNGEEFSALISLNDRDYLTVSPYLILYNDPGGPQTSSKLTDKLLNESKVSDWVKIESQSETAQVAREKLDLSRLDWGEETRIPKSAPRSPFGKTNEADDFDVNETVALDPALVKEKLAGYDMHPSMRYMLDEEQGQKLLPDLLEDKIVLFIGIFLLGALMLGVIWWLFFLT